MALTLKSAIFQNGEQHANFEWNISLQSAIVQDDCQRGKFKYISKSSLEDWANVWYMCWIVCSQEMGRDQEAGGQYLKRYS